MTMTFNPDAAANDKKKIETSNPLAQFESMKFDTAIPEAMRAFASTAVTQSREAYERAKSTLDATLSSALMTPRDKPRRRSIARSSTSPSAM
jgi:hypothetical protein